MNHDRVVNFKDKFYDIYIGRPSKWGNPFSHLDSEIAEYKADTRLDAVQSYAYWIWEQDELIDALDELRGKVLGCFCDPYICHGTILAELVDRLYGDVELKKEYFSEDYLQDVYSLLFSLRIPIEVYGDADFIITVQNIVRHINNNRTSDPLLILKEKEIKDTKYIVFR